jgi:hypothetical protein
MESKTDAVLFQPADLLPPGPEPVAADFPSNLSRVYDRGTNRL